MLSEEIHSEMKLSYYELVNYLLSKYGPAQYDYFSTPACNAKNKRITRAGEGLYCHHIDEDKSQNLGDTYAAKNSPYEWQKKERLVYCNILEHLILHIKISILRIKKPYFDEIEDMVNVWLYNAGLSLLTQEINDMFMNDGTKVAWRKRCYKEINNNYSDYIAIIKAFILYLGTTYRGNKDKRVLVPEMTIWEFDDKNRKVACKVLKVSPKTNTFTISMPNGEVKDVYITSFTRQLGFMDAIDTINWGLSKGYYETYDQVYKEISDFREEDILLEFVQAFKNDFNGYIDREYVEVKLPQDYGAETADEYLSKALPMFSAMKTSIIGKKPIFWKGPNVPPEINSHFYVMRIETMFDIKPGEAPFVRYREADLSRALIVSPVVNESHNFLNRRWVVLETSDIIDSKTGQKYSKTKNIDGKVVMATVILTLGREDYLLFRDRYNIRHMKILDGCYFLD
ncbi:MAG: hypothetical protein IKS05_06775 [Oscillospiraceae bacterium]|nr:hypothetical protein [Oscillospiraceae bacterium]